MATSSQTLPKLPYPDFPLRPHRNGHWYKSVWNPRSKKSEQFYFGAWQDDPKGERALKDPETGWLARRDAIKAGIDNVRVQPVAGSDLTLGELMARFLAFKRGKVTSGELSLKHNKAAFAKDGEDALVFITRKKLPYYRELEVHKFVEVDGQKVKKLVGVKVENAVLRTFRRMVRDRRISPKALNDDALLSTAIGLVPLIGLPFPLVDRLCHGAWCCRARLWRQVSSDHFRRWPVAQMVGR